MRPSRLGWWCMVVVVGCPGLPPTVVRLSSGVGDQPQNPRCASHILYHSAMPLLFLFYYFMFLLGHTKWYLRMTPVLISFREEYVCGARDQTWASCILELSCFSISLLPSSLGILGHTRQCLASLLRDHS